MLERSAWICLLVALCACTREPLHHEQSYVFGTLVEISIWGEDEVRAKEMSARVLREFDRLHLSLHAWKPSELTTLNAAFAKGEKTQVSAELAAIVGDAARLAEQSGNTFNPAIGKLIAAWGFQSDEFKPLRPDPNAIAKLVQANPRMSDIKLAGAMATSGNPSVQLDLGGYAKGYALDVAARMLKKEGVKHALVNIGGNIIALGEHGNRPWRIGIQHPRKAGQIATIDLYDGEAIGTSGDYQRYFELGGKRYCHIIDPRSGEPVQGVQSVTVVVKQADRSGVLSDAASKPIFIAGKARWREAARRMGIELAMLIDGNGEIYVTSLMSKRIELAEKNLALHEQP